MWTQGQDHCDDGFIRREEKRETKLVLLLVLLCV